MVLASTADQTNLENLAQLVDKVVEVATLSVATVSVTCFSDEFEQLRADVTSLKKVVESLPKPLLRSFSQPTSTYEAPPFLVPRQIQRSSSEMQATMLLVRKRYMAPPSSLR